MADRLLFLCWGPPAKGREERALEVFNDAMGLLGRMQQDGRIEKFDVALLEPNAELGGYVQIQGTSEQIAALREDEEFVRNTADAQLNVERIRHIGGYANEGVSRQIEVYREAVSKVPQSA